MASAVRILRIGLTLFCLSHSASSTSWLYNAPRAIFGLAGSASASASAQATPASYIADLRKKETKSAQLQEDKSSVGLEPLAEEIKDEESSGDGNDEGNNEASPSLLQKKIGKILSKLRLIAQIKNAYHYRPEVHEHETNISFSSQENKTNKSETSDSTEDVRNQDFKETIIIEPRVVSVEKETIEQIPPGVSHDIPKEDVENLPSKIDLKVNQISDKLQEFNSPKNGKLKEHEPSRLGALGVFFAELVGSVVGLTYGAVAQITSGGQNPVTISTSEGL